MKSADIQDVYQLQKGLFDTSAEIDALAVQTGKARTVNEYDSDRRKRCLAIAMKPFLDAGDSAASAECKARASDGYGRSMVELRTEHEMATAVLAKDAALRIRHDMLRSLLSMQKQLVQL